MLITMIISYVVGLAFNQSLYFRALRSKQVPYLRHSVPKVNINLRAKMLMQEFPVTLKCVATVQEIGEALNFGYAYYPVLNKSGAVVGSIPHNFLITLVRQKAWYSKSMSESSKRYLAMFKE